MVDFRLDENKLKIFSKSYLGFGLMSARMNIFKFDVLKMIKGLLTIYLQLFDPL